MDPKISLCMIVKDEEDWLEQCLKSVEPLVSEIIIVDTGSTDRSLEIAKAFDAKTFYFKWNNDFSAARNYSLRQGSGDWIFVLDADEAIAASDLALLKEKVKAKNVCYEFLQRHYTADHRLSDFKPCRGDYPELERSYPGFFESNLCRLFPNHRGIEYKGRIHELVEHSIKEMPDLRIERLDVRIHHYGHTPEVKRKKTKADLYSPLGESKTREQPDDWKAYFELGVEHNCNGRRKEAAEAFKKSLTLNPNYLDTWVNYGYVLCEIAQYDEAIEALKRAIKIKADCDQAYCNMGVVFMRQGDFAHAIDVFIRAININPQYVNAFCNLGISLARLGRHSEAANSYYRALEAVPQCVPAKADLGALYLSSGHLKEAENFLISASKDDPEQSGVFFNLATLYKRLNRRSDAATAIERYCEIEERKVESQSEEKKSRLKALREEVSKLRS